VVSIRLSRDQESEGLSRPEKTLSLQTRQQCSNRLLVPKLQLGNPGREAPASRNSSRRWNSETHKSRSNMVNRGPLARREAGASRPGFPSRSLGTRRMPLDRHPRTRVRPPSARLCVSLQARQLPATRPGLAQTPSSRPPRADHPITGRPVQRSSTGCKTALNFLSLTA
jgi:hypothetical protein